MATPESKVKRKVKALLLSQRDMYFNMPVPAGYGEPMLDFVGCHRGEFFAIETKADGKDLTPRQSFVKENMESAGGKVFVITGTGDENDPSTWEGWNELHAWLVRL